MTIPYSSYGNETDSNIANGFRWKKNIEKSLSINLKDGKSIMEITLETFGGVVYFLE